MIDPTLPLEGQPFVMMDTETTGVDPEKGDRVVEFALYRFDEAGKLSAAMTALVNPGRLIDPGAFKAHGISDAEVARMPPMEKYLDAIEVLCEDAVICGHNIDFDQRMMQAEAVAAGGEWLAHHPYRVCTLSLARLLLPEERKHNLAATASRLGMEDFEAHRAAADTKVAYGIMLRLLRRWRVANPGRHPSVDYLTKLDVWPNGKPGWLLKKERGG